MAKADEPRAEAYRDAALERCADAVALLEAGQYASAIWLAGLALECLFRAYHRRQTDRLETGHDLRSLLRASRFDRHISAKKADRMAEAISDIVANWKHRYRDDPGAAVRRSLGVRTNRELRRRATVVVEAAQEVVNHGIMRWHSRH